ncbi:uncharacterized protein LOC117377925 isoform X1 [Periophthalmus magnuspinnatus]|uniref:uncharacterized protein LOC117377925 isoform X1 n=1 Tax=Periophthalmus magnuspinnatus TaxID=409849 RepID=UPI00145BBDA6|nr:uncharacterized protein LOC117377925 isoform X1 [Periophthalmus magnuspinnatus]
MMSLIDLDDDQRWVPTHVNVTILRARGLRTKSKHGSRYLYTIIQVGKEKYTTGLVDKAEVPQWHEECCFELLPGILEDGGRSSYPAGSGDLVLTVMHRVLIGLDVFLGQTIIPLAKIFQEGTCPRDRWFKLHSKVGRKEKERGELQVTVQFTRNNMTASMFDLTMKDKPRSAFGKLKDRVTGRRRGDLESSSAIVPGRYAALSASTGQPFGEDMVGGLAREVEVTEEKRNKMKDFFKGKLRKSSDTRSCSSLASDSSISSMASDNPPPSLDLLSDPPSSPIYTSKVRVDPLYGEADLAKKVLTSQHTTKVLTHKRALSDEASKITTAAIPRSVESLKGQTMTQSKSSLCINGSHVYDSEPSIPKMSGALPSKLVLLEKCAPLSRSLQNLTKKSDEKSLFSDGRRWSFDKTKKDEKEEDKEGQSSPPSQKSSVSSATASPEKGRKFRKTLFSVGRSDSLPAKSDSPQATPTNEGRLRGWFSSSDSQNKPRLEVSPKVESSSDVPPPLPTRSPVPPLPPVSPLEGTHVNPFTTPPSSSPSTTPLSPSNPFFPHLQRNPFFEDLIDTQSPPFTPSSLADTSPFHYTTLPSQAYASSSYNENAIIASIKRDRPKPVPRQTSLPALLPKASNPSGPRSMSESAEGWEESFDVFASSRLSSPKSHSQSRTASIHKSETAKTIHKEDIQSIEPPPLPPRKLLKTAVNEIYSDGWLHRGQELAVHKEAYLLSQTGVACLQRGREVEIKHNAPSVSKEIQPPCNKTSNIQPRTEEKLKYAPLQDDSDCWGGMLFEEDLFGRLCTRNYFPSASNNHLSLRSEILAAEKTVSKPNGSTKLLGGELPDADLLEMPPFVPKLDVPLIDCTPPSTEETLEFPPSPIETCLNNNISFSLTLGDLNMNNCDFGFIDSDASTHSDVVDCYKGQNGLGRTLQATIPEPPQTNPEDVFHLKDTYIPEMNSSFEISTNTLSNISSIGPDTCQDCLCDFQNVEPNANVKDTVTDTVECKVDTTNNDLKTTQAATDDNGNLQGKVVSARLRPKGFSNANSRSCSPISQIKHGEGEFEQFLSLVQNISQEGPLSYQPRRSALCSMKALDEKIDRLVDNIKKSGQKLTAEAPPENSLSKKDSLMSFEDFHAKVTPTSRTPSRILSESSPPIPSALSLTAEHQAKLCPPSIHGPCFDTSVMGPTPMGPTTFTSCTPERPLVDAHQSLLPEETQPASSLPHPQSRTHPVKPLTSSQSEKKEGRSVLEMLKSTISPGRAPQQASAELEKAPVMVDVSQYQDMTNMELISLLLQQEMDMQKQQAASERQASQLEKCEAELRKVKAQVRDLEDYIDNLLLRIMEQTPTLLQVRTRHK